MLSHDKKIAFAWQKDGFRLIKGYLLLFDCRKKTIKRPINRWNNAVFSLFLLSFIPKRGLLLG